MDDKKPGSGTWRNYAGGKLAWQVGYDWIQSQEQFLNRKEIYKGKEVALHIDHGFFNGRKEDVELNAIMIKAAAEFARHNVHNGIVLAQYAGVLVTERLDPMTKEILDRPGRFFLF
ncbi:uncharacterized protein LOC128992990 [Macrosteles quadrilineatus]|uniref:uncharacterized protein LOC128992990 n=1 Tax=Macrosteles quadrilineatus TaxID=74068 RepID=UPI0023E1DB3D|nr:uncharacterized protein LOC128992990 [Macrosteles quadrilineatus]